MGVCVCVCVCVAWGCGPLSARVACVLPAALWRCGLLSLCACMCHVCYIYLDFSRSLSSIRRIEHTPATPVTAGAHLGRACARVAFQVPRGGRIGHRGCGMRDRHRGGCFFGFAFVISRFRRFRVPIRVRAPLRLHTHSSPHSGGRRAAHLPKVKRSGYTRTHISHTHTRTLWVNTHTHTRHRCDSTERTAHRTSAAQTPACTRP